MSNWDQGQLSTLGQGNTLTCTTLAKGQLYAIFLCNNQQNDQDATVLVTTSLSTAPTPVTVPGTTANAGLATLVLVWGGDTSVVAVAMPQSSANPQVQCWLGSVSMPTNTQGITNQALPDNGQPQPFAKNDRYFAVPPSAWQMLTVTSASLTQFISAQFQEAFATIYIVNPTANPAAAVVGVGSVATTPTTYFKIVSAPSTSPQMIQESIIGNGTQWVWMNADSSQDSTAATLSLQPLSALLQREEHARLASYRVTGIAGSDIAGAPSLHYDLLVVASTGKVSGHVAITQALPLPGGPIRVTVTGQVRGAGLGPITQLVALTGTYLYSLPRPAIGTIMEPFNAHFAVNAKWQGRGGFSYGGYDVNDVPVRSE